LAGDIKAFVKWLILGVIVGIIVGLVGVSFHFAVDIAAEMRHEMPYILYCLPLGGILIVFMYKVTKRDKDGGTNMVIDTVRENKRVPLITLPLIYIGTVITHLVGGSSGREGAALQIGSSISDTIGKFIKLNEKDMHIMTMCGMAAAFAALFGTPVTAAIFALEVTSVGIMYFSALVPCVTSALTGVLIASAFGVEPTKFTIREYMFLEPLSLLKVIALAVLCAFVSMIFCKAMHKTSSMYKKFFKNQYIRIIVGSVIVILLTIIVGSQDYNGAGMNIITDTFSTDVVWYAFLLKIIFTAFTLGAGFKGGEIVPTFFTGATFGNFAARFLGINSSFGAGLGIICLFCGVTNCPISSLILSVELFGAKGFMFFALACAVSYMLSGYMGLYSSQKIMYSKSKAEFIDKKAE